MTYGNAVKQREEMLAEYKRMLASETNPTRLDDIAKQIKFLESQIQELKLGKPLFGKAKPLNITTTIIEPDREKPGSQTVTVINPQPVVKEAEVPTPTRLENTLRSKIQAAKAAKK
jgi:hypothetical protein